MHVFDTHLDGGRVASIMGDQLCLKYVCVCLYILPRINKHPLLGGFILQWLGVCKTAWTGNHVQLGLKIIA